MEFSVILARKKDSKPCQCVNQRNEPACIFKSPISVPASFLLFHSLFRNMSAVYLCSKCASWQSVIFFSYFFFNTEVKIKLGQKLFSRKKIFNFKYFILKELFKGTDIFHANRIRNAFSTFQNPANDFQKQKSETVSELITKLFQ